MTKIINFGIVGTGAIAKVHAMAINDLSNAAVTAVLSSSPERAKKVAEEWGVKGYHDDQEFFALKEIDAVCICTASGLHMEPALAAAASGKHVLVEKPIEISIQRADRVIAACKTNDVKLGVVFQNRFSEGYLQLKKAVESGQLGRLLMGNAHINWYRNDDYYGKSPWKGTLKGDGGGALINQGIHTIDLLLDLMGDVASVYGQVKTSLHQIEGEDLGTASVQFRSGALGTITAATAAYPGYPERLEIFGTKGSVIMEGGKIIAWNIIGVGNNTPAKEKEKTSGAADPMAIGNRLHKLQLEDMANAIIRDQAPLVTGEAAKKSLELILAIYKSSSLQRAVAL